MAKGEGSLSGTCGGAPPEDDAGADAAGACGVVPEGAGASGTGTGTGAADVAAGNAEVEPEGAVPRSTAGTAQAQAPPSAAPPKTTRGIVIRTRRSQRRIMARGYHMAACRRRITGRHWLPIAAGPHAHEGPAIKVQLIRPGAPRSYAEGAPIRPGSKGLPIMTPFPSFHHTLSRVALPAVLSLAAGCGEAAHDDTGAGGDGDMSTAGAGGTGTGGSGDAGPGGSGGAPACPAAPWAKRYGDAEDQIGTAIAVDGACNVLVAANVTSSADFGDGPVKGTKYYAGSTLARLDPNGEAIWSRWLESSSAGIGVAAIAVDADGDLIMTWSQTIPGVSCGYNACLVSVAVSPSGGVVVAGTRAVDPANPDELPGLFHRVLSANGDLEAAHELPGVFVHGIAREKEGSWLLAGAVGGHVVSRIDPGGDVLWGSGALAPENMNDLGRGATGIALDPAGDVLLVGVFSGTLDFGTGTLTSAGKHDIFVARLAAH